MYSGLRASKIFTGTIRADSNYSLSWKNWKRDIDAIQNEIDSWITETMSEVRKDGSSLFLYIGAHGHKPSSSHPYGYWSTGVSGRGLQNEWHGIFLDRNKFLTGMRDAARDGQVCSFFAMDDACYGQVADWARDNASSCEQRPAHREGSVSKFVNQFVSVGHKERTAKASEANKRIKELVSHLSSRTPTTFNSNLNTINFGDAYSDQGRNEPVVCQ